MPPIWSAWGCVITSRSSFATPAACKYATSPSAASRSPASMSANAPFCSSRTASPCPTSIKCTFVAAPAASSGRCGTGAATPNQLYSCCQVGSAPPFSSLRLITAANSTSTATMPHSTAVSAFSNFSFRCFFFLLLAAMCLLLYLVCLPCARRLCCRHAAAHRPQAAGAPRCTAVCPRFSQPRARRTKAGSGPPDEPAAAPCAPAACSSARNIAAARAAWPFPPAFSPHTPA